VVAGPPRRDEHESRVPFADKVGDRAHMSEGGLELSRQHVWLLMNLGRHEVSGAALRTAWSSRAHHGSMGRIRAPYML
jgi:hypothetical protein